MWEPVNSQDAPAPGCVGDIALVTLVVVHGWANIPYVDYMRGHVSALEQCDVGDNLGAGWG